MEYAAHFRQVMRHINKCVGENASHVLSDKERMLLKGHNRACQLQHVMVMRGGKLRMVTIE